MSKNRASKYPVIRIGDKTLKRLQALAVDFEKPHDVIKKLLRFYKENHGSKTQKVVDRDLVEAGGGEKRKRR